MAGGQASQELGFEKHEWGKHGTCAGVANATDFFGQVCALSARPLSLLETARRAAQSLDDMSAGLTAAGFAVFATDAHNSQIELSACASNDGQWKLAAVSAFPTVCKGTAPPGAPRINAKPNLEPCISAAVQRSNAQRGSPNLLLTSGLPLTQTPTTRLPPTYRLP